MTSPAFEPGCVGITPPGALGVAFLHHLGGPGRVWFLEREVSNTSRALRAAGGLRIRTPGAPERRIAADGLFRPGWPSGDGEPLPEILLVGSNPDQLFGVVDEFVHLLVALHARGLPLVSNSPIPTVVLASNGIYHQRVRQVLIERLEEAVMLGRLPELWPDVLPGIVARWLRGVTLQTGHREGTGADALYLPGPAGVTTLAGGSAAVRARACAVLQGLGGRFEDAGDVAPVRIEFHKAIINLNGNLLGLLAAMDGEGRFRRVSVADVHAPARESQMLELTGHIVAVGKAVRALPQEDTVEQHFERVRCVATLLADHVPSSVQYVASQLEAGTLRAEVPPTERWLLQPLMHFARALGLAEQAAYFGALQTRLEGLLANLAGERKTGAPPIGERPL